MEHGSYVCECVKHVRSNILSLGPVDTERSQIDLTPETLLLDLNENPFGPALTVDLDDTSRPHDCNVSASDSLVQWKPPLVSLHRYPSINQPHLKELFSNFRNARHKSSISPANVCFSAGVDDLIDMMIRCFCKPGQSKIMTCSPHYHMYSTCAILNEVSVVSIPLVAESNFQLRLEDMQHMLATDRSIRICFLCSPGNPTGYLLSHKDIVCILEDQRWDGIIVVDESYVDFAPGTGSVIGLIDRNPRLVVLHTLSKAFGLANIRVGFATACSHLAEILNLVRKPYAVSGVSIAWAELALAQPNLTLMHARLEALEVERQYLAKSLTQIDGIGHIRGGADANFILFEVLDVPGEQGRPSNVASRYLCQELARNANILLRDKGDLPGCRGCVRVSVGTREQTDRLLEQMKVILLQKERIRRQQKKEAIDSSAL